MRRGTMPGGARPTARAISATAVAVCVAAVACATARVPVVAAGAGAVGERDLDKLFTEMALLRDLALAQHTQIGLLQSSLQAAGVPGARTDAMATHTQEQARRKLNDEDAAAAASGIRILHQRAVVALGPDGDVTFSREGAGQAHVSNTTRFDKIRVNSTDDILIGNCTLTEVLTNDCETAPTRPPTTTTPPVTTSTTLGQYYTCLELLVNHPSLAGADGTYTLLTADGDDDYEAYCDMTTDGGGWTLAAKMTNADDKHWVTGAGDWANTTSYGDTSDLSEGHDARGPAWSNVPVAQFMIRDSENGADYLMTDANSGCFLTEEVTTTLESGAVAADTRHATMAEYWGVALHDFPGYGLADTGTCHAFERCAVVGTYNPGFLSSADAYSQTQIGSGDIQYLTMAFSDVDADTSGVISGLESADYCPEADVALGALEDGTVWLGNASDAAYQQDIGGPSQCNYNDATCAEDYPETVYFFVREEAADLRRGSSCLDVLNTYDDVAGEDGQYVITQSGFCQVTVRDDAHAFGDDFLGKYFHFWTHEVAMCLGTQPFSEFNAWVQQWRRGELVWEGKVVVWDNANGGRVGDGHGRRDDGTAAPGQFENLDVVLLKRDMNGDRHLRDTRSYGAYCDMTTEGGGWTLAAKMTNQDDKNWVNNAKSWSSTQAYGDTATLAAGHDAKGLAWASVPAVQVMLTDSDNVGDYVVTTNQSRCFQGANMADYFEAALGQGFPGYGEATNALRDECGYYERCPVKATFEPDWLTLTASTTASQTDLEYITIAYTDASGDTSAVLSGLADSCVEADVGLGALEDGSSWLENSSYPTYAQDIGGPTYCSYSDAACAEAYPPTVYFYVREADPVRWPVGDTCQSILAKHTTFAGVDGTYTLTNSTTGESYEAFCDMTSDGGGWTLAAKLTNADRDHWVNNATDWTSPDVYGDTTSLVRIGVDAKGRAWSAIPAKQLMLRDSMSHGSYCTTEAGDEYLGSSLSDYFEAALVNNNFPGYSASCGYYERIPTTCTFVGPSSATSPTYIPNWLTSADTYGQSDGIEYITVAYTDTSGDTSAVISGFDSTCTEADMGLGALEDGLNWEATSSFKNYQIDIGGPSQCGYDRDDCYTQYMETVFVFVRE